jgi:hypothetical protein
MKEFSDISSPLEQEPEPQPGVYRSRIFSFIQQQAGWLKNTVGQSWRQVRVSVQWTGEILFAPLRWLHRFRQNPDRQLSGRDLKQLSPTPIRPRVEVEQLLAEVAAAGYGEIQQVPAQDDWSVIDEREWDTGFLQPEQLALRGEAESLTARKPVIRGLACVIVNRSLVLIDQYNQVLDVLSPSQQLHLQRQIDPMSPLAIPKAERNLELTGANNLLLPPETTQAGTTQYRLPAALPSNPWQQVVYWLKFYRDYWQIDDATDSLGELVVQEPSSITSLPTSSNELIKPSTPKAELAVLPVSAGLVQAATVKVVAASKPSKTVFTPEWIETPADNLGYHRSLFVRILEWLDRLMLTIENWLLGLYQRFFKAYRE